MKKETIIAVSLGIGAGILIALLVIFTVQQTGSGKNVISEVPTPSVSLEKDIVEPLAIIKPKNESIISTKNITIEGRAPKNSLIVVQSPLTEKVIRSDKLSFSISIPLTAGENSIKVTSYTKTISDTRTILVYFVENEK